MRQGIVLLLFTYFFLLHSLSCYIQKYGANDYKTKHQVLPSGGYGKQGESISEYRND